MKKYRKIPLVILALVVLAVVIGIEENWRGERDWKAFVQAHQARGESIDFQPLIPPPVPDDRNFAMTPLLAPLFDRDPSYANGLKLILDFPAIKGKTLPLQGSIATGKHLSLEEWQVYSGTDVLDWLKQFDAQLREISDASRRPYSRFPVEYGKGIWVISPHLPPLRELANLYTLRACAELQAGQADKALEDVRTIFRLADSVKDEPLMISQLVRETMWLRGVQVVWEGLGSEHWTDTQLRVLQADLANADFLKDLQLAFQGERASMNATLAEMATHPERPALTDDESGQRALKHITPNGIFHRMQLNANLFSEKYLLNIVDIPGRRIRKDVIDAGDDCMEQFRGREFLRIPIVNPYNLLTAITLPVFTAVPIHFAYTQTTTDQAVIACALERYRLANGQFPDSLDKLAPGYLKAIPLDVLNGEQPHYRLNKNGTYVLYSDGWDGKDNGGKLIMTLDNSRMDNTKSDWIWSTGQK